MTRGIGRLQSNGAPTKKKIGGEWFVLESLFHSKREAVADKHYLKKSGVAKVRVVKLGPHYATYKRSV